MSEDERAPERAAYILQEIRIDGFSKRLGHLRKRYVTVRIDEGEIWKYRKVGISEDTLSWREPEDSNHFEALPTSTFELRLFEAPLVGETGREIGSCTVTLQSLLDFAEGRRWPLEVKKHKGALHVTIIIVEGEVQNPQNGPANADAELGDIIANARDTLSTMQRSGDVPRPDTTLKAIRSASMLFKDGTGSWQPLVSKLEGFMNIVDGVAEVHPYAKMAWSVISSAYKIYKNQKDRDEKVDDLADAMNAAYDTVMAGTALTELVQWTGHDQAEEIRQADRRHTDVLQRLSIQTVECGQFIAKYAKDSTFFMRAGKQILLNPNTIIDGFRDTFQKLQQEFLQQAVASTEIMVVRVLRTVQDIKITADLSGLRSVYVKGAGYNSQKQCLAGTRTTALEEICDWVNCTDDNAPKIRLLLGQAGTGKSTIAHTVACRFAKMKRLGAAFCFSLSATQQSRHAFATLALDLADFDAAFKAALWNGVGQNLADQTTDDLARQFENFLLNPSQEIRVAGPVFILLEGLDEIGDVRARAPLLRILAHHLRDMPPDFRVLLTSRPEADICALFTRECGVVIQNLNTTRDDKKLMVDIQFFIHTELTKPDLGIHGLHESHYEQLTARSESVFQWARLACDYVIAGSKGGARPKERCDDLTRPRNGAGNEGLTPNILDELYQHVLPALIDLVDERARARFKRVMGTLMHAIEPLTMEGLQGLLRHMPDHDERRLRSENPHSAITFLFSRFPDKRVALDKDRGLVDPRRVLHRRRCDP